MTEAPVYQITSTFVEEANSTPVSGERRAEILKDPGFGNYFSDHMTIAHWTKTGGWEQPQLLPYGPLTLDPATSVLHYGQEIFEGMKVYRHADDSLWSFRPLENARRLANSAERLALPPVPEDLFMDCVARLVNQDSAWAPSGGESSLYLRPFEISSEAFLGVRAAHKAMFIVLASPAGSYFASGVKPVDIMLSTEYSRAGRGGTGAAKCGGNYAASLLPTMQAFEKGCSQVCFLDGEHGKYIEELGGMNLFFVMADGTIHTPSLGTILPGITRSSLIHLATESGYTVTERQIEVEEWRSGVASGEIAEVFACGTAAVITPVGSLLEGDQKLTMPGDGMGKVTSDLRSRLLDIQYGRAEDPYGWMTRLA